MDIANSRTIVSAIRKRSVAALAAARGNETLLTEAIAAYLRECYAADVTAGELTDYFCVDSPSILDDAGISERDIDRAVEIFDKLHPAIRKEFKRPL